jgi:hypothetical protein
MSEPSPLSPPPSLNPLDPPPSASSFAVDWDPGLDAYLSQCISSRRKKKNISVARLLARSPSRQLTLSSSLSLCLLSLALSDSP